MWGSCLCLALLDAACHAFGWLAWTHDGMFSEQDEPCPAHAMMLSFMYIGVLAECAGGVFICMTLMSVNY